VSDVVSPMVGKIFKVEVSEGQAVEEDDVVVVLESMKMEMPVEAEVSGSVQEVKVKVGDTVQEGDVLVVLG